MSDACPFCLIVEGLAPCELVAHWPNVWAITPLDPVTPGHVLFIPTVHVTDFAEDPAVSSSVMFRVAQWAQGRGACNLLTSLGADASQSVFHLHLHYVPRRPGDGLMLPWTGQVTTSVMPVFTIKAKDTLAPDAVAAYRDLCEENGLYGQASEVQLALNEIELWQQDHQDEVRLPHHLHVPVGGAS